MLGCWALCQSSRIIKKKGKEKRGPTALLLPCILCSIFSRRRRRRGERVGSCLAPIWSYTVPSLSPGLCAAVYVMLLSFLSLCTRDGSQEIRTNQRAANNLRPRFFFFFLFFSFSFLLFLLHSTLTWNLSSCSSCFLRIPIINKSETRTRGGKE